MAINVGPTLSRPNYHVKLSRSGTEVGLILCDANGDADEMALSRQPYPSTALKTYSGAPTHDDSEPPFRKIQQEDFSGGRGAKTFEDDVRRYADALGVDTQWSKKVILGPLEKYSDNYRSDLRTEMPANLSGNVVFKQLTASTPYVCALIQPGWTGTLKTIELIVKKVGNPAGANIQLMLWNSTTVMLDDYPYDTALLTILVPISSLDNGVSRIVIGTDATGVAVGSSTYYGVGIGHVEASNDPDNAIYIGCAPDMSGWHTDDYWTSGAWTGPVLGYFPYFRIHGTDAARTGHFFQYKHGWYFIQSPETGTVSTLYICGDRGKHTGAFNSGRVTDTSKSWAADCFNGDIVMIVAGTGSEEEQPWRRITDTAGTYVVVDEPWNATLDNTTEYVIVSDKYWTSLGNLAGNATSVAVCGDWFYVAFKDTSIRRYRQYIAITAGPTYTWTFENDSEGKSATVLNSIRHPSRGWELWGYNPTDSNNNKTVWVGRVPRYWGDLYIDLGEVFPTDKTWSSKSTTNIVPYVLDRGYSSIYIDGAFTTGRAAVKNLDEPVDITGGTFLGVNAKASEAVASGNLRLRYSDQRDLGDRDIAPTGAWFVNSSAGAGTALAFTDLTKATDGFGNTGVVFQAAGGDAPRLTQYSRLVFMFDEPFDGIEIVMGSTPNAVAATVAAYYWDGRSFTAVSNFADTTASGGAPLAVDGKMSWDLPSDWEPVTINGVTGYAVNLYFTVADLTDGTTIATLWLEQSESYKELSLPAFVADVWKWVELEPATITERPLPDETALKSIGLYVQTDPGQVNLFLDGGIRLCRHGPKYIDIPDDSRVLWLEPYSSEADGEQRMWVRTEDKLYEMQEEDGEYAAVPLSLGELEKLPSPIPDGHATNSLYLWFAVGSGKTEKYYNRQLDDVGFDLGEGLPSDRIGLVRYLLSYPGRMYAVVDGGPSNYSSILVEDEGWHEVYRTPATGQRIRGAGIQTIPDEDYTLRQRLWVLQGSDLVSIPVSTKPLQDDDYQFRWEGYLITARIHAGLQDVIKYWSAVNLATENLTGTSRYITCQYREAGATAWTSFPGDFNTSPYQKIDFTSTNDLAVRWVDLRFILHTNNAGVTPVLLAYVIDALERQEVKFAYPLTFRLADRDVDLLGDPDPVNAKTKLDQLDAWVNSSIPITMNTNSTLEDGALCFPEPVPVKRTRKVFNQTNNLWYTICQMTLIEI